MATRAGAEVCDQLKYFAERPPATFIYAGIDVEAAGLFAGTRGRQIAGRFTVIPATAFAYGTAEQREQWRALVATMDSTLRLHKHRAGSLVKLDEYLYRRSRARDPRLLPDPVGDPARDRAAGAVGTDQHTPTRNQPS